MTVSCFSLSRFFLQPRRPALSTSWGDQSCWCHHHLRGCVYGRKGNTAHFLLISCLKNQLPSIYTVVVLCVTGLPEAGAGHRPSRSDPFWTSLYETRVRQAGGCLCSDVLSDRMLKTCSVSSTPSMCDDLCASVLQSSYYLRHSGHGWNTEAHLCPARYTT